MRALTTRSEDARSGCAPARKAAGVNNGLGSPTLTPDGSHAIPITFGHADRTSARGADP
jgi:hypothetical protein